MERIEVSVQRVCPSSGRRGAVTDVPERIAALKEELHRLETCASADQVPCIPLTDYATWDPKCPKCGGTELVTVGHSDPGGPLRMCNTCFKTF